MYIYTWYVPGSCNGEIKVFDTNSFQAVASTKWDDKYFTHIDASERHLAVAWEDAVKIYDIRFVSAIVMYQNEFMIQ